MTGVEVLAPLRIETRFSPPDAAAGRTEWLLRLRVYPDEFSIERGNPRPSATELDRLDEALAAPFRTPAIDQPAAFAALAAAVGAPRAVWLWRNVPQVAGPAGSPPHADRSGLAPAGGPTWPATQRPAGLPPTLEVWLVHPGATSERAATLTLDRNAIGADLDLEIFNDPATLGGGELPRTWWLSFARALEVGLGCEITLGTGTPDLQAIVVVGLGDTDPAELVGAHSAAGRLAILAPGTPTNTVNGEATSELGRDPDSWLPLITADPNSQPAAVDVFAALTGASPGYPLLGGDLRIRDAGTVLVQALWPALWGRAFRDLTGAGTVEWDLAWWAGEHLSVEGPYPAIRVGEQPYGLLPVTSLSDWADDPADAWTATEQRIRSWSTRWRELSAAAAEAAGHVAGADTERLLDLLGEHAPSRHWGARPVAPLPVARALRALGGMSTVGPTAWDDATAEAMASAKRPWHPVAPIGVAGELPGPPKDEWDKGEVLRELVATAPEKLIEWQRPLGLLGHLVRDTIVTARMLVGQAFRVMTAGAPVDAGAPLPVWPPASDPALWSILIQGTDANANSLFGGDAGARVIAGRFERVVKSLNELADGWDADQPRVFAALLAALDVAAFRVDPWITGIADRRLRRLTADGAPFRLGAYGWVDRPRPGTGLPGDPPAAGPTPAGLLHAPSHTQALTAALLRDAAVRYPTEDRWALTIDSSKVRAATRLAERVRLGVHPYEALGLEVERLAGDWDAVRILRTAYPLADGQEGRRVCDGARTLRAVLHGAEPVPAGLPASLADLLRPLDEVLDTYADLLMADGVHALVSGHADLANAAMEAAAGLGAPPELRAIRTPRSASTVRVSAWALLPASGVAAAGASPAAAADPAVAELLDLEAGAAADWTFDVAGATVTLADRGLRAVDVLGLATADLAALVRADAPPSTGVTVVGAAARLAAAERLVSMLGGGDEDPPVPGLIGGRDDEATPADPGGLRAAMTTDLRARLAGLVGLANSLRTELVSVDTADPIAVAAVVALAARWRISGDGADATGHITALIAVLDARLKVTASVPSAVNDLRRAIKALSGHPRLPVLPIVPRAALPNFVTVPTGADGPATDESWLAIVAAVRPRLALLEAHQLNPDAPPWPAAIFTPDGSGDPWRTTGPVVLGYGPAADNTAGVVALAALDAWTDSIPSRRHATSAAFGFNGPKSRAPQAILLAVPPDASQRLTTAGLVSVVLETRTLAHARVGGPLEVPGLPIATPGPLLQADGPLSLLKGWYP